MCTVSDIVLEVKTLTDGEIYSIRTLQEIRDTFPKRCNRHRKYRWLLC